MKYFKKVLTSSILMISAYLHALPAMHIDYYGVVSKSTDTNMLKMAQDIFFTQLKSIDNATIDDKRADAKTTLLEIPEIQSTNHLAFYAELNENFSNEISQGWECKFTAFNTKTSTSISKVQTFDSYYNILVNSKTSIEELLSETITKQPSTSELQTEQNPLRSTSNLDSLAGNWSGDQFIDKIVFLRGGRGFVIFKNGASMNIFITINGFDQKGNIKGLKIKQIGKPNASFYPELPREIALKSAPDASPITWEFDVISATMLSGTKKTLTYSPQTQKVEVTSQETTWYKK